MYYLYLIPIFVVCGVGVVIHKVKKKKTPVNESATFQIFPKMKYKRA